MLSVGLVAAMVLAGCSSTKTANRAPVEDRGSALGKPPAVAMDPNTQAVKQPPGFENAGKPGYYTVKPGDTLIRIGLETGQNWRDIGRWNNLDNPNVLEVGQVLRVAPPTAVVAESGAVAKPIPSSSVTPGTPTQAASAAKPAASAPAATASAPAAASGEDELAWIWPTSGSLLAGFDEAKNKGLDIGGKAGDPVVASADGRVVYAGAGLRGYGNLIILKHNNTYLTAYAHNQTLLVKEDQTVRKGQKIAEMGNSDADRVKLHFEIRRQGKPVDPAKYLPAR
ncbi:peptidoglycan DD-metalloendopeptidase family protein [Variovorax terrae]|uniref:Peptidoglycan DD-metalloendopeptidase family protein n=1 Tax=Variovorax terrae TaxID=2923278 RepID=A0A9X2APR7_9BURK|nr:peptidoglycan DD-metalloendopeptidase family protein [Variovorax terrae]MCJ0763807.1 peptidoglycan DD-metalloendopeptidase family protein [Variovorax terrae]